MKRGEAGCEEVLGARAALDASEQEVSKESMRVKHELEKHETSLREAERKAKYWGKQVRERDVGQRVTSSVVSSGVTSSHCY